MTYPVSHGQSSIILINQSFLEDSEGRACRETVSIVKIVAVFGRLRRGTLRRGREQVCQQ